MAPIGLFDVSVFKKYFLGHKEKSDGSSLYGEVLKDPMAVASERKPIASIVEDRKPVDDTPRVEELDEDMD